LSNHIEIFSFGGTLEPSVETTHAVSYWYIPGGWDYQNAEVLIRYFPNQELAEKFVKKYENPPEMAFSYKFSPSAILSKSENQSFS